MPVRSAGILMFKHAGRDLLVLLVHPGGPFWAKKDLGAWSIPKGEYDTNDAEPLACALREIEEEIGHRPPGPYLPLGELKQPSRKIIGAWAVEGDFDPDRLVSNHFEMEWPPRSGRRRSFPEVDRAGWFALDEARSRIVAGQAPFLDRLVEALRAV